MGATTQRSVVESAATPSSDRGGDTRRDLLVYFCQVAEPGKSGYEEGDPVACAQPECLAGANAGSSVSLDLVEITVGNEEAGVSCVAVECEPVRVELQPAYLERVMPELFPQNGVARHRRDRANGSRNLQPRKPVAGDVEFPRGHLAMDRARRGLIPASSMSERGRHLGQILTVRRRPVRSGARLVLAAACVFILGVIAPRSTYPRGIELHARVFDLVDHSRSIDLPDGRHIPRTLETVVRIPARGRSHPLIVFAHGFALTPADYRSLLDAWASAGYVVAAPVFPRTSIHAPGGPTEADLVNQPRDLSFVITRLLALSGRSTGVLSREIDGSRVAVAGQSDGGVTALAVAYDSRYRDTRVHAAVVLSGAPLGGMGPFPRRGPPLLAVQGTADPLNAPTTTAAYFGLAARPKFLLWLLGASHLPPYTDQEPQLGIVEGATIGFLDRYLMGRPLASFERAARRPGLTRLVAEP